MDKRITSFLSIPVLDVFSKDFPYKSFSLDCFVNNNITSSFDYPETILGKQAEAIFEEILTQSNTLEILAANLQINEQKQTLGELDYLVVDNTKNAYYHIELACKFYLFDDTNSNIFEAKWIGSNRKDTLYDKLQKLKNHQFPLLYNEATKPLLKELKINANKIEQRYYITSSFFIPKGYDIKKLPMAYRDCVIGYWQHYQDFTPKASCQYAIPTKKQWLLPEEEIKEWMNSQEVTEALKSYMNQKRAPMLYIKQGAEIEKLFVVWWAF